ncbi:hypothetical protein RCH05_003823 [Janthinobacterium sp. CAN_S7]
MTSAWRAPSRGGCWRRMCSGAPWTSWARRPARPTPSRRSASCSPIYCCSTCRCRAAPASTFWPRSTRCPTSFFARLSTSTRCRHSRSAPLTTCKNPCRLRAWPRRWRVQARGRKPCRYPHRARFSSRMGSAAGSSRLTISTCSNRKVTTRACISPDRQPGTGGASGAECGRWPRPAPARWQRGRGVAPPRATVQGRH